jgi:molecular chaperone GrpE (heat shock protein)
MLETSGSAKGELMTGELVAHGRQEVSVAPRHRVAVAGHPMETAVHGPMESMFSTDFSRVRVRHEEAGHEVEPVTPSAPPGRSVASVTSARRSAANRASEERDALEMSAAPVAVLSALRSPGEPLAAGVRSSFEHSMGSDFSLVRLHSDQVAATSAVQAQAFTVGRHIVLKHRLDPLSPSDDRLLAHELAHVVDQRAGAARSRPVLQRQPDDDREQRAQEKQAAQKRKEERARAGKDPDQLAASEAESELRALEREYRQAGAQQRSVARKAADLERFRKLLTRIPGTTLEKSQRQGAFDELQRTPARTAGKPQGKYVAGGPQLPDQELRPGRDRYAQPDFSMYRRDARGNLVRIHVNLKSDDLNKLTPAQARARGIAYYDQAVRNSAHLKGGEEIVISFAQTPPKEVQEAINAQIFQRGTPVGQVRYGTTTHRDPARLNSPAPVAQTPVPQKPTAPQPAEPSAPQKTAKPAPTPDSPAVKPAPTSDPPTMKPAPTPDPPTVKPAPTPDPPTMKGAQTSQTGRTAQIAIGIGTDIATLGLGWLAAYLKGRVDQRAAQRQLDAFLDVAKKRINANPDNAVKKMMVAPDATIYAWVSLQSSVITTFGVDASSPEPIMSDSSPFIDLARIDYEPAPIDQSLVNSFPTISGGGRHITTVRTIVVDIPLKTPPIEDLLAYAKARKLPLDDLSSYAHNRYQAALSSYQNVLSSRQAILTAYQTALEAYQKLRTAFEIATKRHDAELQRFIAGKLVSAANSLKSITDTLEPTRESITRSQEAVKHWEHILELTSSRP